jgi:hypothetical protein
VNKIVDSEQTMMARVVSPPAFLYIHPHYREVEAGVGNVEKGAAAACLRVCDIEI